MHLDRLGSALLAALLVGIGGRAWAEPPPAEDAVRKASAGYVEAYNKRDYKAVADQWTEKAELVEGGGRIAGREAIVGSIRGWLDRHPQAALQIKVSDVEFVAAPLARVRGVLLFTRKPGEKPIETPFESLRVLEDGVWRLAESSVGVHRGSALDYLGWLVGTWAATDAKTGTTVETTFERAVGGHAIIGRTKSRPKAGDAVESLEIIHADPATGIVRTSILDSTGAAAEGVVESDGTSLNRSLVGVPAATVAGRRVQWVQVVVPGGEGKFTMQSIERSLDGRPLPDGQPFHFRKTK